MDLLFEFLFELFVEFFGSLLLDAFVRSTHPLVRTLRISVVAAAAGAIFGALSLLVLPHHLIHDPALRLAALIEIPLLNATLMWLLGFIRIRLGSDRRPLERLLPAFAFSLLVGLVRFHGAH